MQTASRSVSWACEEAANAAASSCRTPTHSIRSSSRIASVTGLRASPTTPQTWVTPCSARAVTIDWATVGISGTPGRRAERVGAGGRPVAGQRLGRLGQQLARFEPLVDLGVRMVLAGRGVQPQLVRAEVGGVA